MPVNSAMADISNATFVGAIVLYAVAMFAYAVEYAFGRRAAKQAARAAEVPVTVGGGADDFTVPDEYAHTGPKADEDGDLDEPVRSNVAGVTPRQALVAGRIGTITMLLGIAAHAASLATRALATERWPWGNMFEFIVGTSLVGVIAWAVLVLRGSVSRRLGLFVMLTNILLLGASTRVYTEAGPLVPALDSYWIAIHVSVAIIASGIYLVGFVAAVLHLIRRGYQRTVERGGVLRFPFTIAPRLPGAAQLEKLTWRMHVLAFPLWTFSIIAGAIWAREAWSRYWGWDPKEVWAFVAWVVYAAYLHSRNTGSMGRTIAPWIAIIGWGVMLFNLFGVNLVVDSLHSYSGV